MRVRFSALGAKAAVLRTREDKENKEAPVLFCFGFGFFGCMHGAQESWWPQQSFIFCIVLCLLLLLGLHCAPHSSISAGAILLL